jgi:glucose-6-phosphate 1-dehydrogenase
MTMSELPLVITIFGATGDLTHRKLIPALYHLSAMDLLPEPWSIIAVARRPLSDADYTDGLKADVAAHYRHPIDDEAWSRFCRHIQYHQTEFHDVTGFKRLKTRIEAIGHGSANVLMYMAVSASASQAILPNLHESQLSTPIGNGWTRVVMEKPFGSDLASAKALNARLEQCFSESQIFRIDHYLGKESVQNILAFRFANGLFEPTWCRDYVDNIQITVAESIGIEGRGEYYDKSGALRDVGQNHLMQILSLIAMDEPASLSADDIRDAKAAALATVQIPSDIAAAVVRGQYQGYGEEPEVSSDSTTETFVAMKLMLDSDKWRDVPFYVRTGKRMARRVTEVNIEYKKLPADIFGRAEHTVASNVLTLRIQPDEGISLRMSVKKPGLKMELQPVRMEFCYRQEFNDQPDAYERLLLDAIAGDQTLFIRSDEIEQAWRLVDAIESDWRSRGRPSSYESGSWGPANADELLSRDGREWLSHQIATCPIR